MDPIGPPSNFKKKQKTAQPATDTIPPPRKPPDPPTTTTYQECMEIKPLEEVLSNNSCFSFFELLKNNKNNLNHNGLFIPNTELDILSKLMDQEKLNLSTLIRKQDEFEKKMTTSMNSLVEKMDLLTQSTQAPPTNNPSYPSLPASILGKNTQMKPTTANVWQNAPKFKDSAMLSKKTATTVPLSVFTSSVQTPAAPPHNKIVNMFKPSFFIIRRVPDSNPFSGLTSEEIRCAVNKALTILDAHTPDGGKIEIRGAMKMISGDIKFFTANRMMTSWLLNNKHKWTHLSDPALITRPTTFPAILHSVPSSFNVTTPTDINLLCKENNLDEKSIMNARWLRKNSDQEQTKTHGSLVINFLDRELSLQIERGGLFFKSNFLKGAHYKKPPTTCFNCFEIGHTAQFCKNKPLCAKCAEEHNSRDCDVIDDDTMDNFCQRCVAAKRQEFMEADEEFDPTHEAFDFNHNITSLSCPSRVIPPKFQKNITSL